MDNMTVSDVVRWHFQLVRSSSITRVMKSPWVDALSCPTCCTLRVGYSLQFIFVHYFTRPLIQVLIAITAERVSVSYLRRTSAAGLATERSCYQISPGLSPTRSGTGEIDIVRSAYILK